MAHNAKTVLEWTYEPAEFFEESVNFHWAGSEIVFDDGSVRGEFDAKYYEEGRGFRDKSHEAVRSQFLAEQIHNNKSFVLSDPAFSRVHADGRRDVDVFPNSLVLVSSCGSVDIVVKDKDGNVISDTKAERLALKRAFRQQVAHLHPTDRTLRRLLQSYENALNNSENALIHLYEIREAIAQAYGGEAATKQTLNVSGADWSQFGRLANVEPVLEGRHRGKHSELRAVSTDELTFMRSFARLLIEKHVSKQIEIVD